MKQNHTLWELRLKDQPRFSLLLAICYSDCSLTSQIPSSLSLSLSLRLKRLRPERECEGAMAISFFHNSTFSVMTPNLPSPRRTSFASPLSSQLFGLNFSSSPTSKRGLKFRSTGISHRLIRCSVSQATETATPGNSLARSLHSDFNLLIFLHIAVSFHFLTYRGLLLFFIVFMNIYALGLMSYAKCEYI